jgi:hypothetical protein
MEERFMRADVGVSLGKRLPEAKRSSKWNAKYDTVSKLECDI